MGSFSWLLVLSSAFPLTVAVRANRATSLFHAVVWGGIAWIGWALALAWPGPSTTYVALALVGCAGVAVLGARRPGVTAWNFVVAGLLVVLLLPLAESVARDTPLQLDTFRLLFLIVLIGTAVVNYLPTRRAAGAALLGIACGCALSRLVGNPDLATILDREPMIVAWCAGLAPWAAWAGHRVPSPQGVPLERLWRAFRDRFGLVWGLRLLEQYNRAAANAGLGLELTWTGLRVIGPVAANTARGDAAYEVLVVLVKRFGLPLRA